MEKNKVIVQKLKYRKKWWHPFVSEKIVRINLCEHDWVEMARGQYKKMYRISNHYDYYPKWDSKCLGDTMIVKCKRCGEIKTVNIDIVK